MSLSVTPAVAAKDQPFHIKEDAPFRKVLACIPLVGIFPSAMQTHSLVTKVNHTADLSHRIALLQVTNQYLTINIVRSLLTIALHVIAIARGILYGRPLSYITVGALLSGIILFNMHRIYHNEQTILQLQQSLAARST